MLCKFKWSAPLLKEGGGVELRPQVCSLELKHEGDHVSISKITAPNTDQKK